MLHSKMYLSGGRLRQWIKAYWIVEGHGNGTTEQYRLMPDGCATLVLMLNGSLRLPWYQNGTMEYDAYVVPPNTEPHHNLISDDVFHIDIQLNPGVFYRLFNISPGALGNKIHSLRELSIPFDPSVLEQLLALRHNPSMLIARLDRMMETWFDRRRFKTDALLLGLSKLYRDGDIDRFFTGQGLSIRQLQRNVKTLTGISPKTISRIGRFYAILETIKHVPGDTKFSYNALEENFSDQSHFIREFKSFTGMSPNVFIADTTPYLQYEGLCCYHREKRIS